MNYLCPVTQTLKTYFQKISNADSFQATNPGTAPTNTKTLMTAGSSGSIVKALTVFSDDSVTQTLNVWLSSDGGTNKFLLGQVTVPTGLTDILASLVGLVKDQSGKSTLPLLASAVVYVSILTQAVTANKTLYLTAQVEDF